MKRLIYTPLLFLFIILGYSCSETASTTTPVKSIALDRSTLTISVGNQTTLIITISPNNATNKTVSWASSNKSIATVANGKVTAVAAGTANITVMTNDGNKKATCAVIVNPVAKPVTAVSLSETNKTLIVGDSFTLTPNISPVDATNKTVSWASDMKSIATVANGVVTAVATGTANITVMTNDGSKKATCTITVNPVAKPVTGVSLSETTKTIIVGQDFTLTATVAPNDADNKTVSWASSDGSIATVDAIGKVTAIAAGTANITVTTNNGSKKTTCVVMVNPVPKPVTAVSLSETTKTLTAGEDFTLTATVAPNDADNKTVSWASSDGSVATVDANGKVTAVAAGTANITVTTNNGSKKATCVVTVNPAPISVTEVTLDETTKTLAARGNFTLIATVTPDDATDKTISWASDMESIATVDANGKVTAVATGTANITVTTNDGSKTATCIVTVNPAPISVTEVTLDETTKTLAVGEDFTLIATVTPDDATDKTVSWASDMESIATVDANGKVTAIATGKANITVSTNDGSKTATCIVTVKIPLEDISHSFDYGGHKYYVINNEKTWVEAAAYAVEYGGYLVHINTEEEQKQFLGIFDTLLAYENPISTNTAKDGGDVIYAWIGATDKDTEGTWVWDGDNDATTPNEVFGTGQGAAGTSDWVSTPGKYNKWGSSLSNLKIDVQEEPDNFTDASFNAPNGQDYGAMGIDRFGWPNGFITQWNDIAGTNVLPFIIEIE